MSTADRRPPGQQGRHRPARPVRQGVAPRAAGVPARRTPQAPVRAGGPSIALLNRRRTVLVVVVTVLLTVWAGRMVWLQGFDSRAIAAEALTKRLTTSTLIAARGQITDGSGEVLATSVDRYDVIVNQQQIPTFSAKVDGTTYAGAAGAAQLLAPLLDTNAAELGAKLDGDAGWKPIARSVLPEVWQAISELRINGISAEQKSERVYPNGNLAGNVLGWVNSEGVGAGGLESTLDDELSGTDGSTEYERGRGGQQIPGGYQDSTAAVDGRDVQLTLNSDLQYTAQQAIEKQVAATGADSGSIVAIAIKTGEILAIAESSTVDPNDPGSTPDLLGGSSAVASMFEPGSTAKIITMAAAIETGLVDPYSQFDVPYQYTTANGQTFKDSHEHAGMHLTTTGILAQSSNTGTVMIGQNLPEQVRYDYLKKFGFGEKTGVELPGEISGTLHEMDGLDGRSKYAILFGQAVSVTALQATSVFATIANGGVRVTPHLVKGWTEPDGTFTAAPAAEQTQVVSEATADTVLSMMESAVDEGTASAAAIPGYRVAGKTGTAQAWAADGTQGITASFIGVAPVDDPQIVVSVVLHNPRTSEWGGTVAAPVFSEVAGYALTELGIAPSGTTPELFPTTW